MQRTWLRFGLTIVLLAATATRYHRVATAFSIPPPALWGFVKRNIPIATAAMASTEDEFGDCSFLNDIDLTTIMATAGATEEKRRKISVSPPLTGSNSSSTGNSNIASSDEDSTTRQLKDTLQTYFGYTDFRTGQLDVIRQILDKRDVAVFWATGQGKSLCYQIPALFGPADDCHKVVIVVSPLISLMQDQVHKLNSLATSKHQQHQQLATYLGSGQTDGTAETRALNGEVRLVYMTPEKLSGGTMLERLSSMHLNRKEIALVAIDEAHCVSEWGFDFRPEFRQVGSALRNHVHLRNIPILALTATAVPRVQKDICTSLQLRNPFVSKQSLDRANLKIRVVKRSGVASAMKELLAVLNAPSVRGSKESTIVYASTRSQVEELALYLNSNLQTNQSSAVRIDAYHAGLSQGERNDAHTRFLTGATTVIVATVAFGMGIDKPDTRRVIHYGCSKTLEEYYQQIGRAGRDGLPAECIMYVSEVDFDRYKSEFYMGGLKGYARHATETSMAALRSYCLTSDVCRRKALLTYFQETPAFGERCGNCDVCLSAAKYGSDSQRDFGPLGAQVLLQAIDSLADQGLSQIVKVVSGSTVENHRYKPGMIASSVRQRIEAAKEKLVKKYTQEYYRDLISPLTQKGYLIASSKTANPDGFSRTWTVYNVSEKGRLALMETQPIVLPVTDSVRQMEQQEEEKRQKVLEQLERNGIQLDKLPQNEVETGDGVVIRAYTKWYAYVENAKKAEKDERVAQLEALVGLIETWRSDTAGKQRIAPASVLAEHLLYAIAYTAATMQQGGKLSADALEAVGVRSREIGALVHRLGAWVDEVQPARSSSTSGVSTMILLETSESKGWQHAVYKPQKKTGMMTWEQSYVRFVKGESPQAIAMTQASGRPIQANTVVGHLLDAITYGRKVDLRRLVEFVPAPTQDEWDQLRNAEISTGIDVTGNPDTSGLNGDKFLMKDFLRPIVGDRLAELPFTERSESERQEFTAWCDRLKWYMVLRRVGFEPSFSVPE